MRFLQVVENDGELINPTENEEPEKAESVQMSSSSSDEEDEKEENGKIEDGKDDVAGEDVDVVGEDDDVIESYEEENNIDEV